MSLIKTDYSDPCVPEETRVPEFLAWIIRKFGEPRMSRRGNVVGYLFFGNYFKEER